MTMTHPLVADYLDRLFAASKGLTRTQVEELLADVREHIANAVAAAGREDEVTIRTVLDRLGTPEEIVAAAAGDVTPQVAPLTAPPVVTEGSRDWTWRELAATVLILPGAFLAPVVAPLIGVALAWSSSVWDAKAKRVAYVTGGTLAALPALLLALGVSLFLPFATETSRTVTTYSTSLNPEMMPGDVVTFAVVPDTAGMTEEEAVAAIGRAGFVVETSYMASEGTPIGQILSIEPSAGTQAARGSIVRMAVSIG